MLALKDSTSLFKNSITQISFANLVLNNRLVILTLIIITNTLLWLYMLKPTTKLFNYKYLLA